MLGFIKANPIKRLKKQHGKKLEEAMLAQRRGDIRSYSQLMVEAEAIYNEIKQLESSNNI